MKQQSREIIGTIYQIALLWFGEPNARFAKFFACAGVALIAAPWWQPILQELAAKHLDIKGGFVRNADRTMFWSGWVFVAIALGLYVWITTQTTRKGKANSGEPIEVAMEYYFNGSDSILTLNTPTNPLLAEGVVAVYPTSTQIESFNEHYAGLIGEGAVRNCWDGNSPSLSRYVVEVTRFEPILSCKQIGASRGAADAIEAVFLLSCRSGQAFPWCFDAKEVLLKTFEQTKKLKTPYNLKSDDLVALRYFINARDAGIYFVHCVVYILAKGSASPIRVPLHDEPIAIGFYEIDESEPNKTDDWIEFPRRGFA